jgi:hypothetical protein
MEENLTKRSSASGASFLAIPLNLAHVGKIISEILRLPAAVQLRIERT